GGVGLANVREQLANRFGERASFRLRDLAGQGTCAEVVVPLEPAPEPRA
ncbi:MAG: sensor histidine kinase, partial [Lysobacteraceae bacterium]